MIGAEPTAPDILAILQGACRWIVGASFMIAGVSKLRRYEYFASVLRKFPIARTILGRSASIRAAVTLSAVESALGVMFFLGLLVMLSGGLILVLLLLFTGISLIALVRGEQLECGCFGETRTPVSAATIFRNLGLGAIAILGTIGTSDAVAFPGSDRPFPQTLMLSALALQCFAMVLGFVQFRHLMTNPYFVRRVPSSPPGETQTGVWAGIREPEGMTIHG